MNSPYLDLLKDRITLDRIPFTDRDARLLLFRRDARTLWLGLAEYETDPAEHPVLASWQFTDEDGHPYDCACTTYPHQVICDTPAGHFRIAFADPDTLLVALPPQAAGIVLRTSLAQAQSDGQGGALVRQEPSSCWLIYATNAPLLRNEIVPLADGTRDIRLTFDSSAGGALVFRVTRTARPSGVPRPLPDAARVLDDAARRWHAWFAAAPPVDPEYRSQYYHAWWILGANLIRPDSCSHHEGVVPSKLGYVGVWHWDAYFHALALRHADPRLAREQIGILLDHQLASGLIPDVVHDHGVLSHTTHLPVAERRRTMWLPGQPGVPVPVPETDLTKPPLTAWAAWKLYEIDGDVGYLRAVYEPIARFQRWWLRECDADGNGLCEYRHPYCSGLDDSPLWDQGPPVEAPELNAFLCLQADTLSRIARALGQRDEADAWTTQAERLMNRLMDVQWDAGAGVFWATRHGRRLPVRTPFNLLPLITGRLPEEIARRIVETLTDERQFWPRFPVPTVALNDPAHAPATMWRGPVWLNVNYLMIEALRRSGWHDVARELRRRTLDLAVRNDDLYEYYHPVTGERPARAAPAFGWSAAVFIDLAIEASRRF